VLEVYLCLLLWAWFFSDRIIFQPPPASYAPGGDIYRIPVAGDEKIAVFGCTNGTSPYVVLHAHGNAEDIGGVRFLMEEFCAAGFSAFTFDYRGYGLSDGRPGTSRAYEDGEAALRHLIRDKGIPADRIILHGRSVGAAIAIRLASQYDVAGLVVESGFVTAFRVQTHIPISPFDKMRNNRELPKVRCPVLVIHGEADQTVPPWHGRKLYQLAPDPKLSYWVPGAGHDDVLITAGAGYWTHMQELVKLAEKRKEGS